MKKFSFDKKYLYWGLTALAVIAVAISVQHILDQWEMFKGIGDMIVKALRPIIIGLVIAYILNPLMNIYEKHIFKKIFGLVFKKNEKLKKFFTRFFSVLLTMATAIALVAWLILLIIPELYVNIEAIVKNLPGYIENGLARLEELSKQYPEIATPVAEYLEEVGLNIVDWAKGKLLPGANAVISNVYSGIYSTFKVILDIILGVIVCIYVLASKEKYAAAGRKLTYAVFEQRNARKLLQLVKYTHNHFGGFLVGKIVDSAIIGLLSFVVFTIFDIPYTTLISVVVGVTNVIPFFGPFIGAIPSALLILLVDPVKAFVFAILILVIQQLDGNIIGPKVLGDSTGMDSFMVIFAILFSGGLFGITGVILGVPVFATLFGIVQDVCNKKLRRKNMPVNLSAYNQLEVNKNPDAKEDKE